MTAKPLVSVVTPSFNQGKYLEETILSVLNQDYANLEYIVIDGGSTDNTLDILNKYRDRISIIVSEPDRGQTDAINKGFTAAHGEILAWLNSDDTYTPGAVTQAVAYLVEHPETGLVYGELNFIDENSRLIGKFHSAQTDLKKLKRGYLHLPQPTAFFRTNLWLQVGPLDPTFYFAMDYDLWVRLANLTQFKYLPGRIWANFRLHQDAKTVSADDRCWPEMLRVHYRNGGSWFSPIVAKYYLRKFAAPIINYRRRKLFKQ